MSIIKRNGDTALAMPAYFNDLFTRDLWNWGLSNNSTTNTTIPAVNIKETADSFVVDMAAPGMKKNDFTIELDGNLLSITSEKQDQFEEKDGAKFTRKEFAYQAFQRTFQLPKEVVDADKIEAKYDNGVLHLVVPKKEEAKQRPPRMIKIL